MNLLQKEVLSTIYSKTIIVNSRGSISVDGTKLDGNGIRNLNFFLEGVRMDIKEFGPATTTQLYREINKIPGRLGQAMNSSINLRRQLDADIIAGK